MKRKILFTIGLTFFVSLIAINLQIKENEQTSNVKLKNIKVLTASASEEDPCSVLRDCCSTEYCPDCDVFCSGNECSSGSDDNGWVECDGDRTYCDDPDSEGGCGDCCYV